MDTFVVRTVRAMGRRLVSSDSFPPSVAADAIVPTSDDDLDESPSPPYLKLIDDCWEHIFDYLSFRDILTMAVTCKKINQMAGYYVREYYPELEFDLIEREIRFLYSNISLHTDFYKFITKLRIDESSQLDLFQSSKTFDSLKTLVFNVSHFGENHIECMRNVLKNIEKIELKFCTINGNTFEQIAVCCSQLKYLNMHHCRNLNSSFNTLLLQDFPMLIRLKLRSNQFDSNITVNELKMFLKRHKNLKQLEIDFGFFWEYRDSFIQANIEENIRLDLLNIYFYEPYIAFETFNEFGNILKSLYVRGFYKTLQIQFISSPKYFDRELLNKAISRLSPALDSLHISNFSLLDLTRMTDLKQLHISVEFPTSINIECLAKSLTKLERLFFSYINIDMILPFIRHSKRLKAIKFHTLSECSLDAFALNEERKTFGNDRPVTIYMRENIYLRTKWKSRNSNLDLIQIKRLDTDECYFD